MENTSDNSLLVTRLSLGDERAYADLMDRYHRKLCIYAGSLINDGLSAEDIVQAVFVKLWKRRKKLKPPMSLERFLYRSVYNEFIDQYRKRMTMLAVETRYHQHLQTVSEDYDDAKMERAMKLVFAAIQQLPPKCREIFLLSKKNGWTNLEIAEHLGISIKTVETQITIAFKALRQKLDEKLMRVLFLLFRPGHAKAWESR